MRDPLDRLSDESHHPFRKCRRHAGTFDFRREIRCRRRSVYLLDKPEEPALDNEYKLRVAFMNRILLLLTPCVKDELYLFLEVWASISEMRIFYEVRSLIIDKKLPLPSFIFKITAKKLRILDFLNLHGAAFSKKNIVNAFNISSMLFRLAWSSCWIGQPDLRIVVPRSGMETPERTLSNTQRVLSERICGFIFER